MNNMVPGTMKEFVDLYREERRKYNQAALLGLANATQDTSFFASNS